MRDRGVWVAAASPLAVTAQIRPAVVFCDGAAPHRRAESPLVGGETRTEHPRCPNKRVNLANRGPNGGVKSTGSAASVCRLRAKR